VGIRRKTFTGPDELEKSTCLINAWNISSSFLIPTRPDLMELEQSRHAVMEKGKSMIQDLLAARPQAEHDLVEVLA
jgi:hypothetical protein